MKSAILFSTNGYKERKGGFIIPESLADFIEKNSQELILEIREKKKKPKIIVLQEGAKHG